MWVWECKREEDGGLMNVLRGGLRVQSVQVQAPVQATEASCHILLVRASQHLMHCAMSVKADRLLAASSVTSIASPLQDQLLLMVGEENTTASGNSTGCAVADGPDRTHE